MLLKPGAVLELVPTSLRGCLDRVSYQKGAHGYRSSLVEENKHQRVEAKGASSRLRAANSITALICSRSSPSNHSRMSLMFAPASKFSKMTETGIRVPRSTQAPLTFPGTLSTAGHCDQSRAGIRRLSFRSSYN